MALNEAERLKLEGNKFFSKGNYLEAIRCYNEAVKCDPGNAIFYSNRAFAHIKRKAEAPPKSRIAPRSITNLNLIKNMRGIVIKCYLQAERDCDRALQLNDSFDKAYYRRGIARKELKRFKLALDDFTAALKISPNSADIKAEYESLKELLQKTKRIKLEPIEKDDEFRSKTPLREVKIEDGTVEGIKRENETSSEMYNRLRKMAISHVPKNYVEFERSWREVKAEDRLEYLERIDIATYRTIFTYPFDPQMLFEVIQALGESTNKVLIYQVLQAITSMPRFDVTIIFFSNSEKEVLKRIFHKLASVDMDKEKITALLKLFQVELL